MIEYQTYCQIRQLHTEKKPSGHLYELESWIRLTYIFDGNDSCYKHLKDASNNLEHGISSFDEVMMKADSSADQAFMYVRSAILRELNVPANSPWRNNKYEKPLAGWSPSVQIVGTYTDQTPTISNADGKLTNWPLFLGTNIHPSIRNIEDMSDTQRNIQLGLDGNGRSLVEGQTIQLHETNWSMPGDEGTKLEQLGDVDLIISPSSAPKANVPDKE